MVAVLATLVVTAFATVWIVAFQALTYEPRLALPGLPALACLAALGVERWRVVYRFFLPIIGVVGTALAVRRDVLDVPWMWTR